MFAAPFSLPSMGYMIFVRLAPSAGLLCIALKRACACGCAQANVPVVALFLSQ